MGNDDVKDCSQSQGMHSSPRKSRSALYYRFGLCCALLCLAASAVFPPHVLAGALDQLSDLTDKAAQALVTLKGRDNFNSEYLYDVSVKNLSSDPLVGESLIIILDKITNIGGDEWMAGTSESYLRRMEILGQDGETDDGKPYFRIPRGSGPDLPPYTESSPASVRIRNKDYLIVFTPFFRVYGMKRPSVSPKPKERVSHCLQPRPPPTSSFRCSSRKACSLKKKGASFIRNDSSQRNGIHENSLCDPFLQHYSTSR